MHLGCKAKDLRWPIRTKRFVGFVRLPPFRAKAQGLRRGPSGASHEKFHAAPSKKEARFLEGPLSLRTQGKMTFLEAPLLLRRCCVELFVAYPLLLPS